MAVDPCMSLEMLTRTQSDTAWLRWARSNSRTRSSYL